VLNLNLTRSALAIVALLFYAPLFANDTPPASPPRYTFSWQLDGGGLMPRGGTTKGPSVTLDKAASPEWQRLQEKGLSDVERDRRAILAMAGTYRVTFDFLEVTPFGADDQPKAPYQSWGTEKVYVDSDQGEFISLVHILEMRIVQPDGKLSEPMVTKHWRQDWTYQPTHIVRYQGNDRWERRMLAQSQSAQRWVQTVYQVDESPRYASLGKWSHTGSFSSWLSEETWRPLPRREWSVRDDYQVLAGTNRHTVLATGWVQEENNLKAVLTQLRELDPARPYVGREYGVARYERIRDADFAAADSYYERTKAFWDQVRDRWSKVFAERGSVTLKGPVDKLGLFQPLFAHAEAIAEQGASASKTNAEVIDSALKAMGAL
jgi:hypothetical protein